MKKKGLILFLSAHVVLVILLIHKHSQVVKLSYAQQKLNLERDSLLKYRDELMQQLHALKTPEAIQKYAQQELGMKQISLKNIKKIEHTKSDLTST